MNELLPPQIEASGDQIGFQHFILLLEFIEIDFTLLEAGPFSEHAAAQASNPETVLTRLLPHR